MLTSGPPAPERRIQIRFQTGIQMGIWYADNAVMTEPHAGCASGGETGRWGGRVLLLDQQALLGEALAHLLAGLGVTTRVTPRASQESMANEVLSFAPDLVILEVGATATSEDHDLIAACATRAPVLVLGPEPEETSFAVWVNAGASGRIATNQTLREFTKTIDDVCHGHRVLDIATENRLRSLARAHPDGRPEQSSLLDTLTEREAAVLQGMLDGHTASDIAKNNFVALATVRSQIQAVLKKLRVNSQLAAVAVAHRHGWSYDHQAVTIDDDPTSPSEPTRYRRRRQPLTLG